MNIALAVLVLAAVWAASLYVHPFGGCPRCHGRGHLMRGSGKRQRRISCPRCKGSRRRQRPGSRTIHQLARRIRAERDRQRAQHAAPAEPKE